MTKLYRCSVWSCLYIAESSIEDFAVCALHDAPATRGILEELRIPASFWKDGRPIVLPVGDLTEACLVKILAHEGSLYAWQDPKLASVPTTPSKTIHPKFDLTRGDS